MLNAFGRTFKENGYRMERSSGTPTPNPTEITLADSGLTLDQVLPMSMRVQGRPFVKRSTDARFDMQVVHELELQVTGTGGRDVSYFANITAADEADWTVELGELVGGWHPSARANLVGGYGPMTFVDPYNTFASRRLTQDRPSPNSAGFETGYRFRDPSQFVSFYGRERGLFYSATVGTGTDDPLGTDKKDYLFRAAYDLPRGLSVGAFALTGDRELIGRRNQDYSRTGTDVQFATGGFTANAAFYRAREDAPATLVPQTNNAWYLQAFYATPTTIPIVPVVRYESVASANGNASTESVALAVIASVRPNVNVSVDFTKQTATPRARAKTNRVSFLVAFGL